MRIEHVALYVNDLEKTKKIFMEYLGAKSNDGYHNQKTGFCSYFLTFDDGARIEIMHIQFNLFVSEEQREKQEKMDQAVDDIRRRFGYFSVQKAFMYQDKALASLDAQSSHTVHPIGYFNGR